MTRRPSPRRRSRGAQMVEITLVLLSLISMILFILDVGRILFVSEYITERARSTARVAVVNNWTEGHARNYFITNNPTPATQPPDVPSFLGLRPGNVTYTTLGNVNNGDFRVKVTVSGVPAVMFVPFLKNSYTLPPISVEMLGQSMGATN